MSGPTSATTCHSVMTQLELMINQLMAVLYYDNRAILVLLM